MTIQYLHYISDEYQITDGGKTASEETFEGQYSVTQCTISTGQVVLAFSQRQQCLFNLKIGTFKDIKVWSSQGLKRRKFPNVIRTDRQTEN